MPQAEKNPPPSVDVHAADPFAWDPDPLVLVSRRGRALYFPGALLRAPATDAQVKTWTATEARTGERDEKHVALLAGVNFLGALTSTWALRAVVGHNVPTGAPAPDKCALLWPYTSGHDRVTGVASGNVDRETGRLRPDRVQAAILRVLEYHRAHADTEGLWSPQDAFDAPELAIMRLSELFRQASPEASAAHSATIAAIKFARRTPDVTATLGGLHDYAVRAHASAIFGECRQWWARKKLG
jgi:hypothetical protein